jgi:hypothetical protein
MSLNNSKQTETPNNFTLSIPQKLELYQVLAYLEEASISKAQERVEFLLKKAKGETKIDGQRQALLSKYSMDQILDAADKQLSKDKGEDIPWEESLQA